MTNGNKFLAAMLSLLACILGIVAYEVYAVRHDRPVERSVAQSSEPSWRLTNRDLQFYYEATREEYFQGRISADAEVLVVFCDNMDAMGETYHMGTVFFVCIDSKEADEPRVALMTEDHEMVHIELAGKTEDEDYRGDEYNPDGPHGKLFQKEMQRLALEGAFEHLW